MKKKDLFFSDVLGKNGRIQRDELVTAFGKCGLCSDGKILYTYEGEHGCWVPLVNDANRRLRGMIPSYLHAKISSAMLTGVVEDLVENPALYVDFRQKMQPYKLNMKNATVDLKTGEKVERSQSDFFDYYINAECLDMKEVSLENAPNFEKFLRTSLAVDKVPERVKLSLQILGYSLCSILGVRKMVFIVGPSGSGKSIFLQLIEHIVGVRHCSFIALQDMSQRFRLFELANARVNLCYEAQNSKIKTLSIIKQLVANEPFLVERKGIDPYPIKPITKLFTAANCLPPLGEADNGAVIARMLLILFPHSISAQERRSDMLQSLIAEKDIIVTLAIKELQLLIQSNFSFVLPEAEKTYLETYTQTENSVKSFAEDECFIDPKCRVHYDDLLKAYRKFCENNSVRSLPDMDVKQYFLGQPGICSKKFRLYGRNLWGLEGVGLIGNTFTRIPESITGEGLA